MDEIYKQKVTLAREQFNNSEAKNQNNVVTDNVNSVGSDGGDTSDVLSKSKMDKPLKLVSKVYTMYIRNPNPKYENGF